MYIRERDRPASCSTTLELCRGRGGREKQSGGAITHTPSARGVRARVHTIPLCGFCREQVRIYAYHTSSSLRLRDRIMHAYICVRCARGRVHFSAVEGGSEFVS